MDKEKEVIIDEESPGFFTKRESVTNVGVIGGSRRGIVIRGASNEPVRIITPDPEEEEDATGVTPEQLMQLIMGESPVSRYPDIEQKTNRAQRRLAEREERKERRKLQKELRSSDKSAFRNPHTVPEDFFNNRSVDTDGDF